MAIDDVVGCENNTGSVPAAAVLATVAPSPHLLSQRQPFSSLSRAVPAVSLTSSFSSICQHDWLCQLINHIRRELPVLSHQRRGAVIVDSCKQRSPAGLEKRLLEIYTWE